MKTLLSLVSFLALGVASTFAATYSFTQAGGNIPDYWSGGTPSLTVNFTVSGLSDNVTKVTLSLNDFAGNAMSNCRVDLKAGSGPSLSLCDGVGPSNPNGTFVFDDSASTSIIAAVPSGGTYQPQTSLSGFSGLTPSQANVTWTIWAIAWNADTSNHFASATLEITTVPEPAPTALLGLAGVFGFTLLRRRRDR